MSNLGKDGRLLLHVLVVRGRRHVDGLRSMGSRWDMDYGLWTMVHGLWDMDYGTWAMGHGLWDMDYGTVSYTHLTLPTIYSV